jgi:hypothetical protein
MRSTSLSPQMTATIPAIGLQFRCKTDTTRKSGQRSARAEMFTRRHCGAAQRLADAHDWARSSGRTLAATQRRTRTAIISRMGGPARAVATAPKTWIHCAATGGRARLGTIYRARGGSNSAAHPKCEHLRVCAWCAQVRCARTWRGRVAPIEHLALCCSSTGPFCSFTSSTPFLWERALQGTPSAFSSACRAPRPAPSPFAHPSGCASWRPTAHAPRWLASHCRT